MIIVKPTPTDFKICRDFIILMRIRLLEDFSLNRLAIGRLSCYNKIKREGGGASAPAASQKSEVIHGISS